MAVITIAQVIEHAEKFENMIADLYSKVSAETAKEGVKLLADYMSRHRLRTREALSKLPEDEVRRLCNTPLRYEPFAAESHCLDGIEVSCETTAAELFDMAVKFDERLIDMYNQVIGQPIDQNVKSLFESLVEYEKQDELDLKKIRETDSF